MLSIYLTSHSLRFSRILPRIDDGDPRFEKFDNHSVGYFAVYENSLTFLFIPAF